MATATRLQRCSLVLGALVVVTPTLLAQTERPALAEQRTVARTGAFAVGVHTPTCDTLLDGIAKYASRGLNYAAHWVGDGAKGMWNLVQGKPQALLDHLSRTWRDAKTAAGAILAEGGVGALPLVVFEELFKKVLPDSGISEFMRQGRRLFGNTAKAVGMGVVDSFEKDVSELGTDLWDIVSHIDDPKAFVDALGNKMQKWHALSSLSYVFTEGDPLKGAEKAAAAILRQAEILTTYIAPAAKAPTALVNNTGKLAKAYNKLKKIPGMPGPGVSDFDRRARDVIQDQIKSALSEALKKKVLDTINAGGVTPQHQQGLVTLMGVIDARLAAGEVTGEHPFYRAELRRVKAEWMGDNHEDGGKVDWSMWHPIVEDGSDCISLGDDVMPTRGQHVPWLAAVCGDVVRAGKDRWWTRPIDYDLVWGDNCSGGEHNRSIWAPVCPAGYAGLGFVAWGGSWTKPLPNRIACLQDHPQLLYRTDGRTAGLTWVANDEKSGAKYSVSLYRRFVGNNGQDGLVGMTMAYAKPGDYPGDRGGWPRSVQVPVLHGAPHPTHGIRWKTASGEHDLDKNVRMNRRKQAAAAPRAGAKAAVRAPYQATGGSAPRLVGGPRWRAQVASSKTWLVTPGDGERVIAAGNGGVVSSDGNAKARVEIWGSGAEDATLVNVFVGDKLYQVSLDEPGGEKGQLLPCTDDTSCVCSLSEDEEFEGVIRGACTNRSHPEFGRFDFDALLEGAGTP